MTNATVTIWTMRVGMPSPSALARWQAVLDEHETAQAARFRVGDNRYGYIAAHALARSLLATLGGQPPAAWKFRKTEKGKPEIADPATGLQFSLSHTNGFVACAAASGFAVGIDAESRERKLITADVVKAVLASGELAHLRTLPDERHQETFLRFWTLREAYVKATGQGISYPREDFSFVLDPAAIQFANGSDSSTWQFFAWHEVPHIVSLAANHSGKINLEKRHLTEGDLL